MNDRAALLSAIRADPRDEALRLVFADWLEEFGDEDDRKQADFIRMQCRFEPLRDEYFDEQAETLRWEVAGALQANRDRWLGPPMNDTSWEHYEDFHSEFERGM